MVFGEWKPVYFNGNPVGELWGSVNPHYTLVVNEVVFVNDFRFAKPDDTIIVGDKQFSYTTFVREILALKSTRIFLRRPAAYDY